MVRRRLLIVGGGGVGRIRGISGSDRVSRTTGGRFAVVSWTTRFGIAWWWLAHDWIRRRGEK